MERPTESVCDSIKAVVEDRLRVEGACLDPCFVVTVAGKSFHWFADSLRHSLSVVKPIMPDIKGNKNEKAN